MSRFVVSKFKNTRPKELKREVWGMSTLICCPHFASQGPAALAFLRMIDPLREFVLARSRSASCMHGLTRTSQQSYSELQLSASHAILVFLRTIPCKS